MRFVLLLFVTIISVCANAKDLYFEKLYLSANIKRSEFFNYSISHLAFEQNSYTVEYDLNEGRFKSVKTKLNINTTIPDRMADVGFFIEMIDNKSECVSFSDESLIFAESFTSYSFKGQSININESLEFEEFTDLTDGFQSENLDMTIDYDPLERETVERNRCYGQAVFLVGLDI